MIVKNVFESYFLALLRQLAIGDAAAPKTIASGHFLQEKSR